MQKFCRVFYSAGSISLISIIVIFQGLNAVYVNFEKLLDKQNKNQIIDQFFYDNVVERMKLRLNEIGFPVNGLIPIVTGIHDHSFPNDQNCTITYE